jgi:hypothetical protein
MHWYWLVQIAIIIFFQENKSVFLDDIKYNRYWKLVLQQP